MTKEAQQRATNRAEHPSHTLHTPFIHQKNKHYITVDVFPLAAASSLSGRSSLLNLSQGLGLVQSYITLAEAQC